MYKAKEQRSSSFGAHNSNQSKGAIISNNYNAKQYSSNQVSPSNQM
jgi:hypothetical protein